MPERVPELAPSRSAYDAPTAAGYDAFMAEPAMRRRWRMIDSGLLDAVGAGQRVLVLGCGSGRLLEKLKARTLRAVVGVDRSAAMLERARGKKLQGLVRADAHALPFAGCSFDVVIAGNGVFRELEPERALSECRRVLRPGGRLALHHYAARCWTRAGYRAAGSSGGGGGPGSLERVADFLQHAAAHGFSCRRVQRYRPVRLYPYALPIPGWTPGHLWLHCAIVLSL